MNLFDVIHDVRWVLMENGCVSLRMLRKQFQLHDEALDEPVDELGDVQHAATLEGAVLVHTPASAAAVRYAREQMALALRELIEPATDTTARATTSPVQAPARPA